MHNEHVAKQMVNEREKQEAKKSNTKGIPINHMVDVKVRTHRILNKTASVYKHYWVC